MAATGGTRTIVTALIANFTISIAKFFGFVITSSSAMLAEAVHSLADKPHVKDIRNLGVIAGIELHPDKDGNEQGTKMFNDMWDKGLTLRPGASGCVALSPPLILNENHIDQMVSIIGDYLDNL